MSLTAVQLQEPSVALRQNWHHLLIVWAVSLTQPLLGSTYYLLGATSPTDPLRQKFRLVSGLATEVVALLVLWYVIRQQGRTWRDLGWNFRVGDVPSGIGLLILASLTRWMVWIPMQIFYRSYSGHFVEPTSLNSAFGFGISALSVTFILLNPFFEELIVRAYTMSEVIRLGGSGWLAVFISVALQMSYHLYQGAARAFDIAIIFAVFSIYYVRTRRVMPLILAHLGYDLHALLAGRF